MTANPDGMPNDLERVVRDLALSVDKLTLSVTALEVDVQAKAEQIAKQVIATSAQTRQAKNRNHLLFALVFAVLLATWGVIIDNHHQIQAMQAKFCPIIEPLVPRVSDPAPTGSPDQVARTARIRVAFKALARDFNCVA